MKKLFFYLIAGLFATSVLVSCHRNDDDNNSTTAAISTAIGTWTIAKWDNGTASGTFDLKSDGTFNLHETTYSIDETGTYTISGSSISFTHGGGGTALSGGNPWAITQNDAHNLKMTSKFGLKTEFTK